MIERRTACSVRLRVDAVVPVDDPPPLLKGWAVDRLPWGVLREFGDPPVELPAGATAIFSVRAGRNVTDELLGEIVRELLAQGVPVGVRLVGCERITAQGLARLGEVDGLVALDLAECAAIGSRGLASLARCRSLRWLSLRGWRIDDADAGELLESLEKLEALDLSSTKITTACLAQLHPSAPLAALWIANTRPTAAGLAHLTRRTALRWLDLSGCAAPPLDAIADVAGLEALGLAGCRDLALAGRRLPRDLIALDLTNAGVRDADVAALAGLGRLGRLALDHCPVTDACVAVLEQLPALRDVQIDHTRIGAAAAARIGRGVPERTMAGLRQRDTFAAVDAWLRRELPSAPDGLSDDEVAALLRARLPW